jgi:hypothetical protein
MTISREMLILATTSQRYYWQLVYAISYHYDLTSDNAERWLWWRLEYEVNHPSRVGRILV